MAAGQRRSRSCNAGSQVRKQTSFTATDATSAAQAAHQSCVFDPDSGEHTLADFNSCNTTDYYGTLYQSQQSQSVHRLLVIIWE